MSVPAVRLLQHSATSNAMDLLKRGNGGTLYTSAILLLKERNTAVVSRAELIYCRNTGEAQYWCDGKLYHTTRRSTVFLLTIANIREIPKKPTKADALRQTPHAAPLRTPPLRFV